MARSNSRKARLNTSGLAAARFFAGIPSDQIVEITGKASPIEKRKGAWFFRQGDRATHFYLLQDGRVDIHHFAHDGNDILLRIMTPLEIFGYRSIDPNGVHFTSIQAAENSVCLAWPGSVMRDLFLRHPQLAINAFQIASEHMFEFETRYQDLATLPVEKRVARMLLELARRLGRREGDVIVLGGGLLEKEIGQMTGASVFSVSRIFAAWHRDGILRRSRSHIVLRRVATLEQIAAGVIAAVAGFGALELSHSLF